MILPMIRGKIMLPVEIKTQADHLRGEPQGMREDPAAHVAVAMMVTRPAHLVAAVVAVAIASSSIAAHAVAD